MNISMGLSSPLQRSPLSLKIRGHQTSKKRLWHLKSKKRPMAKHRCGRPKLNPIELIWANVKNYCGTVFSNSTRFKEQRQHLEESFKKDITPEYCTKVYEHVQKIEERYWNTDLMIDDEIEIEDDEFNQF